MEEVLCHPDWEEKGLAAVCWDCWKSLLELEESSGLDTTMRTLSQALGNTVIIDQLAFFFHPKTCHNLSLQEGGWKCPRLPYTDTKL